MTSDGFILSIYIVSTNVLFKFTIYLAPGGGGGGGGWGVDPICLCVSVCPAKIDFHRSKVKVTGTYIAF